MPRVLTVALLLAAAVLACSPVQAMATVSTGSALAPLPGVRSCAPAAPVSLASWQAAWGRVPGWAAGDGAYSVRLPDGRTFFAFGDSATYDRYGHKVWLNNTLVSYERTRPGSPTALRLITGETTLIPRRADGSYYWPGPMVVDGGRLWMFATRIQPDPVTGFRVVSVDVAEIDVPRCGIPRLVALHESPSSGRVDSAEHVMWGAGVLRQGEWVYVYGSRTTDNWLGGRNAYVARVPTGHLRDTATWEFWTGAGWSPQESAATAVFGGVEDRFSVRAVGDKIVVVTKWQGIYGDSIDSLTADSVTGFYGRYTVVPNVPWSEQRMTYLAQGHDLRLANGHYLVDVSLNAPMNPLSVFWTDPARFRPQWFEVMI